MIRRQEAHRSKKKYSNLTTTSQTLEGFYVTVQRQRRYRNYTIKECNRRSFGCCTANATSPSRLPTRLRASYTTVDYRSRL